MKTKLFQIVSLAAVLAFAIAVVGTAAARSGRDYAASARGAVDHASHHGHQGPARAGHDDDDDEAGDDDDDDGGGASRVTSTTTTTTTAAKAAPRTSAGALAPVAGRRLVATVGPGYTITLKTPAGAVARTVKPGVYTIAVRDLSDEHNVRLRGPGVSRATSIDASATATWRVKLVRGTYRYVCDPHASMMKGTLAVR